MSQDEPWTVIPFEPDTPSLPLIRDPGEELVHIAVQWPYRCPTPCDNDLCDYVCHEEHKISSVTWTHHPNGCVRAVGNTRVTLCGRRLPPPLPSDIPAHYRILNHTSGPLCETCKAQRTCPIGKGFCAFYVPCPNHNVCFEMSKQ